MVFSSTLFLFVFFPLTLAGYYILRGRARNYWLLFVSVIFFAWSQPKYLWIIILNVTINWAGAFLIDRFRKADKAVLILTIIANLAILFYFKYFDFVIESVNYMFGTEFALKEIILPIGISFFTFQGMSYTVDVYRKDVPVQKNILKVGLYVMLFPQLIAGPIVRYADIAAEIDCRKTDIEDFTTGSERFIKGLGKKAIISNTLAVVVDSVWENGMANLTGPIAWLASIAYTLQIYFDFSGYSDMAIGIGRMFGFHFNENFNLPYISKSITEFWRRWHISLSSWFRDYVYIPLGGNRKHVYLNLSVVFLLTGIWHGASWNFVVWGLWNLLFILIERVIKSHGKNKKDKKKSAVRDVILSIYTLSVVNMGWILFRAPNLPDAWMYIRTMFGAGVTEYPWYKVSWYFDRWTVLIMAVGIFLSTSLPEKLCSLIQSKLSENVYSALKYTGLLLIMFLAMLRIVSGTYNPFIYFQF